MSLPITLLPYQVAVYGFRSTQNILFGAPNQIFGTVTQIWDEYPNLVSVDQSVFFEINDSAPIQYGGSTYYIVEEQKIKFIENSGLP